MVSEHVQFVRDPSRDGVFPVIGCDEFVGAEDPQHRIIYALPQGQKSVDKPFSRRLGHMFASHIHVIEIGFRSIENADFGGMSAPYQEVENRFVYSPSVHRSTGHHRCSRGWLPL